MPYLQQEVDLNCGCQLEVEFNVVMDNIVTISSKDTFLCQLHTQDSPSKRLNGRIVDKRWLNSSSSSQILTGLLKTPVINTKTTQHFKLKENYAVTDPDTGTQTIFKNLNPFDKETKEITEFMENM